MRTTTQRLMLQGGLVLVGALIVSSLGGWARGASADDQPAPVLDVEHRRVVADAEQHVAAMIVIREIAGDDVEFAETHKRMSG